MPDVVELAVSVLSQSERRAEIAAQNLANATTPAYKRKVAFSTLVNATNSDRTTTPRVATAVDFRNGKFIQTNNPYDLAVAGRGYFSVRFDSQIIFTRHGQFRRDGEGRLVNAQGGVLQLATGADVVVKADRFEVRADGTIVENGQQSGRIAVFGTEREAGLEPRDGGFAEGSAGLALLEDGRVVQGSYEASNVTTGDEMVVMMEALRRAEAGQRIMNVYDDIMGRVITTFGEAVR